MTHKEAKQILDHEQNYLSGLNSKVEKAFKDAKEKYEEYKRFHNPIAKSLARGENDTLFKIRTANEKTPPYWGRFDIEYQDDGHGVTYINYIGHGNIPDPEDSSRSLVTDWRHPVCDVFKNSKRTGRTSYVAQGQSHNVDLKTLRSFQINSRTIESIVDDGINLIDATKYRSDSSSKEKDVEIKVFENPEDEILSRRLKNRSASPQMRNFVESLQNEQDQIIRLRPEDAVIVLQGPAGSGKTGCALQRAAWFLYQEREKKRIISGNHVLVLSPNAQFSSYVSTIMSGMREQETDRRVFDSTLRNLLTSRIRSSTQPHIVGETEGESEEDITPDDVAIDNEEPIEPSAPLGRKLPKYYHRVERRLDRLEMRGKGDTVPSPETAKLKASPDLLPAMKLFVEQLEDKFISEVFQRGIIAPSYRVTVGGSEQNGKFATQSELSEDYSKFRSQDLSPIEAFDELLSNLYNRQKEYLNNQRASTFARFEIEAALKNFEEQGRDLARKTISLPIVKLYQDFWSWVETHPVGQQGILKSGVSLSAAISETRHALKQMIIPCEDIVPILLLDGLIYGFTATKKDFASVQYVIVDEGQDYSPLHFEFLKTLLQP